MLNVALHIPMSATSGSGFGRLPVKELAKRAPALVDLPLRLCRRFHSVGNQVHVVVVARYGAFKCILPTSYLFARDTRGEKASVSVEATLYS